ncbi:hypothetical protein DFH09DRAFT_384638 [Mycena vulgaris]|nr:hypothetical protein DFH09DRAFT_384638 [Mycena vulgaris]
MVLKRLGSLSFCALSVFNPALLSTNAAPLGHPSGIYGRGQYTPRQSEIGSLVANITGHTVSDDAGLAQTLGSLFGGSPNSSASTSDAPSATADPFTQITGNASVTLSADTSSATISDFDPFSGNASTPSAIIPDSGPIISQYTATATFPVATGIGSGSDAEDAYSILSEFEKLLGASPTLIPSVPVGDGPISVSPTPGGFDEPGAGPDVPNTSQPQHGGHHGHGGTVSQNPDCAETYTVVSGDTCAAICSVFDLSAADFLRMNPTVGAACMNLQIGQEYCVQPISEDKDDEEEDGFDEEDEEEDGGYKQNTVVHVHNHPWQPSTTSPDGYSPGGIPVLPPVVPSVPMSPIVSDLPIPALPTPDSGSNTGLNSTAQISTSGIPTSSLPSSNSTSTFNSTGDPDPSSSAGSPTPSMGDTPLGNDTTVDPLASQPAPSNTSLPPDDPLSMPTSTSSSGISGMAGMGSRAAPVASAVPKAVKLTFEEDF